MGYGGIPTYFGPTGENAYGFFRSITERQGTPRHVDNPRDMFDMLNVRERAVLEEHRKRDANAARTPARLEAARAWRAEFFQNANPVFQKMYSGRRAVGTDPAAKGVPGTAKVAKMRQLGLLMSRYWKVKIRDKAGAMIMFLQAPIIGVMLAFVFAGEQKAVPFWCLGALEQLSKKTSAGAVSADLLNTMVPTQDHSGAMFFVVVSCVWFGTSNAAREICTERAVYLRERMVNLQLVNYVLSKFIILAAVCVIQCVCLLGIVFFTLGFNGGITAFLLELGAMVAVAINACALGLLLSTVVASAEAAMALTPIALIPQVVLGGLMVPMTTNPILRPLMFVMPARWGFEGAISQERYAVQNDPAWLIDLKSNLNSPPDFVYNGHFQCAIAQMGSDSIMGAWGFVEWANYGIAIGVLVGMTALMLLALLVLLKRRDPV
jgi:ABC-type multidrug transport system permease subunit